MRALYSASTRKTRSMLRDLTGLFDFCIVYIPFTEHFKRTKCGFNSQKRNIDTMKHFSALQIH